MRSGAFRLVDVGPADPAENLEKPEGLARAAQDSPPLHQTNLYCKGLIFILEDTAHENKRMLCDF